MPGYDCKRFVDKTQKQQLDELMCGICKSIVCQPIVVQCCQQAFCTDCIKEWLVKQTTCPYDRKQLTIEQLSSPPRILVNLLSNLKIKCDFWDKGCPVITTVQQLTEHTANCPHNVQQCPQCLCNYTTGARQPFEHNCLKSMTELNHKTNAEILMLMNIMENLSQCNLRETFDDDEFSDNDILVINYFLKIKLRKFMGTLGIVSKLLHLIDRRVLQLLCDDVMLTAWSILWNITDENKSNCQQFITNNGLDNFLACRQSFSDNQDLISRMMGVLANVAECSQLRSKLLTENYLDIFLQLLATSSDGMDIGISFMSAGILTNIVSDGPDVWSQQLPVNYGRDHIVYQLYLAIGQWKINTNKQLMNYNSLVPIISLLKDSVPNDAKYWPVWTLANLTRIKANKYCPMLLHDKGVKQLRKLAVNKSLSIHIRDLSRLTLYQYYKYRESQSLSDLEDSSDMDIPVEFGLYFKQHESDDDSDSDEDSSDDNNDN
ncbi:protein zer-1 homolog [Oppia nitens]|uniref:protein zer-1 homolog n=1 Tax=Oppia nitens TaxID=1686743 RepID=UPI0023D9ED8D|nr:protein zer-1 homolog [Oppia nitens]